LEPGRSRRLGGATEWLDWRLIASEELAIVGCPHVRVQQNLGCITNGLEPHDVLRMLYQVRLAKAQLRRLQGPADLVCSGISRQAQCQVGRLHSALSHELPWAIGLSGLEKR
jgi:hypothetical protein